MESKAIESRNLIIDRGGKLIMLRINRRKMIGLLLLSVSAIVYVFALASGQDSIFEYTLLLACLTFALLFNNDFELISPAVLFTAYFLYSIALGPIGLMNMGRFYSYGYTKIILGGLLAFAIGNGICLIAKKRPVHEKEDKPKIRFSFRELKHFISFWLFHGLQRYIIL